MIVERLTRVVPAAPERVFAEVERIGGEARALAARASERDGDLWSSVS